MLGQPLGERRQSGGEDRPLQLLERDPRLRAKIDGLADSIALLAAENSRLRTESTKFGLHITGCGTALRHLADCWASSCADSGVSLSASDTEDEPIRRQVFDPPSLPGRRHLDVGWKLQHAYGTEKYENDADGHRVL